MECAFCRSPGNFHAPFSLWSVCLLPLDKNHTGLEGTGGVWDVEYRMWSIGYSHLQPVQIRCPRIRYPSGKRINTTDLMRPAK